MKDMSNTRSRDLTQQNGLSEDTGGSFFLWKENPAFDARIIFLVGGGKAARGEKCRGCMGCYGCYGCYGRSVMECAR